MVEIRVKQRAEFVIVDDEISSMPFTVCVCDRRRLAFRFGFHRQ